MGATGFSSVIVLVLALGVVIGVWVGLVGLWRTHRGAAWWLMAIGAFCNTLGPILTVTGSILWSNQLARSFASSGPSGPTFSGGPDVHTILMGVGALAIPVGLLLFGIGFAIHGLRAARAQERVGELEQLTQAMDEEITRLKQESARL
jgi:hypothetical protein